MHTQYRYAATRMLRRFVAMMSSCYARELMGMMSSVSLYTLQMRVLYASGILNYDIKSNWIQLNTGVLHGANAYLTL